MRLWVGEVSHTWRSLNQQVIRLRLFSRRWFKRSVRAVVEHGLGKAEVGIHSVHVEGAPQNQDKLFFVWHQQAGSATKYWYLVQARLLPQDASTFLANRKVSNKVLTDEQRGGACSQRPRLRGFSQAVP